MKRLIFSALVISLSSLVWILNDRLPRGWTSSEITRIETSLFSELILISDKQFDGIVVYLIFPSGEASNTSDEGLAHYVEHLAWLSAFGGGENERIRHSNAWTNHFSTGYWQKTTKGELHSALRDLTSVTEPFDLDPDFALEERKIVLREYDYRVAERPMHSVFRDMERVLYGSGAMSRSVIGEPSVIAQYSMNAAIALHQDSHALSQAILVAYGDINSSQLKSAVQSLADENEPAPTTHAAPILVEDGSVQDRATLALPEVSEDAFLYRKLVPLVSCGGPVMCQAIVEIAEDALDSTLPGGLAGALRFDHFVARSFSLHISIIGGEYAELSFVGYPDNGVPLEELENTFKAALLHSLTNGLPQDSFDRISAREIGGIESVLDRDRPSYNLDLALNQLTSGGAVFTFNDQLNAARSVDLTDVNKFLKSLLAEGREVTRLVRAGK